MWQQRFSYLWSQSVYEHGVSSGQSPVFPLLQIALKLLVSINFNIDIRGFAFQKNPKQTAPQQTPPTPKRQALCKLYDSDYRRDGVQLPLKAGSGCLWGVCPSFSGRSSGWSSGC